MRGAFVGTLLGETHLMINILTAMNSSVHEIPNIYVLYESYKLIRPIPGGFGA